MSNQTLIRRFRPYVIEVKEQSSLEQLPLKVLLNKVTQHKIVVLRGFAPLQRDALLEYCQSQAELLSWDFGPVMEMKVDKNPKNYLFTEGDVPLHWDGAFHQEPRFLLFNCIEAPLKGSGGETLFVNTESVWQAANPQLKEEWGQLSLSFHTEKLAHYGGSISRRLVNTHPDTGCTILRFAEPVGEDYLNPVDVGVVGKSDIESKKLLFSISQLMRHKQYLYQHEWQQGDYLIADNFSLLHGRNSFKQFSPRHLRRIQIL